MDSNDRNPPDDIQRLKREIEELRQRLQEQGEKGKQLSLDTELLIKKTQNLTSANKISCSDPNWRKILESMQVGPEGIWIADVATPQDIQFIALFAAVHQLIMTYGNRSFHLSPRG